MATYNELFNLFVDSPLLNRTSVAVCVKAQAILDNDLAKASEVVWAGDALKSPKSKAEDLLRYVLAKNKALTPTQIQNADDATLQTAVDAAIDALIAGGV